MGWLRVIGLAEIGVEHLLSAGLFAAGCGLDRDKYGIDLLSQAPGSRLSTPNAPVLWHPHAASPSCVPSSFLLPAPPRPGSCAFRLRTLSSFKSKAIESERFAFSQEDSSKGFAEVAIRVGVADINDMQLAGRHKFPNIAARRCELPLLIERGARDPQLI